MFKLANKHIILIAVLFFGILIRVVSLSTYLHMDERTIIDNAMYFANYHTLTPKYFYYPTFYSYFAAVPIYLSALIYTLIDIIPRPAFIIPLYELNPSIILFFPRSLTVLFALTTFILLYQIGRRFFSPLTGITASFCLLLSLTHIKYSAYVKPDIAQAFFSTCVLYMCFRIMEHRHWAHYIGSGIFAGLVVACKYNGISIIFLLFAAHILSIKTSNIDITLKACFDSKIIVALTIVPFVFLLTSPVWITNPSAYISALHQDLSQLSGNDPAVGGILYLQPIIYLFKSDSTLFAASIAAVFYGLYTRTPKQVLLLALIIPSFLYIGSFEKKLIAHYLIFIFPAAALLIGERIEHIFEYCRNIKCNILKIAIFLAIFAMPSYNALSYGIVHLRIDNRYKATDWIYRNVPQGKTVVMDALTPYVYGGYSPPIFSKEDIDSYLKSWQKPVAAKYLIGIPYYQKLNLIYSEKWVSNIAADFLITNSLCYKQFFDLVEPRPDQQSYRMFVSNHHFYQTLLFNPEMLGWQKRKTFDDGQGPTIIIFERI